jgi:hypothetical protein
MPANGEDEALGGRVGRGIDIGHGDRLRRRLLAAGEVYVCQGMLWGLGAAGNALLAVGRGTRSAYSWSSRAGGAEGRSCASLWTAPREQGMYRRCLPVEQAGEMLTGHGASQVARAVPASEPSRDRAATARIAMFVVRGEVMMDLARDGLGK